MQPASGEGWRPSSGESSFALSIGEEFVGPDIRPKTSGVARLELCPPCGPPSCGLKKCLGDVQIPKCLILPIAKGCERESSQSPAQHLFVPRSFNMSSFLNIPDPQDKIVKITAFCYKKPDVSWEYFIQYWRNTHVFKFTRNPRVEKLLLGYVQVMTRLRGHEPESRCRPDR